MNKTEKGNIQQLKDKHLVAKGKRDIATYRILRKLFLPLRLIRNDDGIDVLPQAHPVAASETKVLLVLLVHLPQIPK